MTSAVKEAPYFDSICRMLERSFIRRGQSVGYRRAFAGSCQSSTVQMGGQKGELE
jgi:hypothetical protein